MKFKKNKLIYFTIITLSSVVSYGVIIGTLNSYMPTNS